MSVAKPPGSQRPAAAQRPAQPARLHAADIEPVTASEVRIKLDLARQFLDMGDPASARHILDEVLAEGDATQKKEAQRLVELLP